MNGWGLGACGDGPPSFPTLSDPSAMGPKVAGLQLLNVMLIVPALSLHKILFNVPVDNIIPLGSMTINSISKLIQLNQSSMYSLPNAPTLADLEDDVHEGT